KTHDDLQKLRNLLAHQIPSRDPAAVIARALELLLADTLAKKAAITDKPRQQKAGAGQARDARHIPAAIRRPVWRSARGQCTYQDATGRGCSEEKLLEYHHLLPWAKGGKHPGAQIALRCRAHNQFQADLDFGIAFMEKKRHIPGDVLAPPTNTPRLP